jgi:hypothetical protein
VQLLPKVIERTVQEIDLSHLFPRRSTIFQSEGLSLNESVIAPHRPKMMLLKGMFAKPMYHRLLMLRIGGC